MANKPFNTRIQLKHDTEEHWILATGFSPKAGELIIYDVDATHSSPRFKVGDGTTNVNNLPFATAEYAETDPTVPAWAKAATKPTYTAQEVGALPESTVIPTKTSDLTNDSGFLTAHQDISGKADKSATVSNIVYDTTNKKITKTINGTTSDVISAATLKTDMSLSNVENKSSATIRGEITSKNVTDALGFTPTSNTGTVTSIATGIGLTGGNITGSGTIKAKLKSETALTNDSTAATETSGRIYPIAVDKSGYLAVNVPWTDSKPVTSVAGKTGVVTLAKGDVGLGNVDNKSSATIRSEITSSNVTTALGFTPLNASLKGANNGVAELDASGKVPSSQLPSYVDDVLEYIAKTGFPSTGETGKIYVDTTTNKTYRWSGSDYVEISASLALGTTSSTAYRGDYGNAAYTHAVTNKGSAFASGLYKITTNSEGHVIAATAVAKSDITALGIPGSDTDTHRPIQVNGTQALASNTTALNLKAGSNVTITDGGSGAITIAATDTNTWRPVSDSISSTSSSDAASSKAVKTAYDLAASKTANTGTVTSVATGVGLTGGTITDSGTLKAKLRSETALTIDSAAATTTSGRVYPVAVDKTGYLAVNVPWTDNNTTYTAATAAPGNIASSGSTGTSTNYARQDHTHGISLETGDFNGTVKIAGTNVPVKGLGTNAYIAAPLFITTSNNSATDALTYNTTTPLSTGQLVFVTLNKAMIGSANATLKFGSNTAINIYLTGTTQLKAKYAAGTMLGLVYNGTNLYMINPPVAV